MENDYSTAINNIKEKLGDETFATISEDIANIDENFSVVNKNNEELSKTKETLEHEKAELVKTNSSLYNKVVEDRQSNLVGSNGSEDNEEDEHLSLDDITHILSED